MKKKSMSVIWCVIIGLVIAAVLKIFIIERLTVEGISMEPTLGDKEHIFVCKAAYGIQNPFGANLIVQWATPKEDDLIVYFYNNRLVVKRCVAVENAALDYLTDSEYILMVNLDKKIPLTSEQYFKMKNCPKVPSGYILAIGDNYTESYDSRNYGFIPVSNVLGKVICR